MIGLRHGGSGPPLLLVHGNPENHTCRYKVAAKLTERYHVVLPDLRGYGDSSLPAPGPDNINFSFREMARDLAEIMEQLGHQRFMVAEACLMDILPNSHVWTNSTKSWAIGT